MADLIKTLASHMVSRKSAGREPYVLVLGAGASLSSGCSSYSELVDDFLQQFCPDDLPTLNEEQDARSREESKRGRFYEEWRKTGKVNQCSFLLKHLGGDPSSGYEHLASLVHQEYFRLIFSTNLDNHVERAFTDAGLAPNQHYEPLTNGPGKEAEITRRLEAPTPPVKVVKLHGTLSDEDSYAWLPDEVLEFEEELEDVLRLHLNKDVVILGHRMDDRDLDIAFRRRGGEIWFVNPGGARDTRFSAVLEARAQSRTLTGDAARFDDFFATLRTQIEALESGAEAAAEEPAIHRFLREIGLPGQITEPRSRYLHLPELYVKPEEYEKIRGIRAEHHAVVIAGDPHMGKTYTALHLLWDHFQQGRTVVHMKRDALAAALQQCGHIMDEFAARHLKQNCLLHLDDPFGEIEYQPLGPLQKELSRLVREVRHREDCGLIITSRIGIFNQAMGHLEGAALLREMGVEADIRVHTSYSANTRREVLERYLKLYEPPWTADDSLRARVLAEVPRILEAPHNLELFVRRSEGISEEGELLDFARSCREMVPALAEWMGRIPLEDQLILVLTESFGYRDIVGIRDFHRKVLARAYEQGLVEHIPGTAWDSALDRLRDIVTVAEERDEDDPVLSCVHPSYAEALRRALGAGGGVAAVWLLAMTAASAEPDPRWRAQAAAALAGNCGGLDADGRTLLASLAADEAVEVRLRLASSLARNYPNLGKDGWQLIADLADDLAEEVRSAVASSLPVNFQNVDEQGQELLASLAADEGDNVRGELAAALAGDYENLDEQGRKLLTSLSADQAETVRGGAAAGLAWNHAKLDEDGWRLLACLAADQAEGVRKAVVSMLGEDSENLDAKGWKLLASLAADEAERVRIHGASSLAFDYENLDERGRKLLASLAADQAYEVRAEVASWLAFDYENLDGEGRKLLEQVKASLEDH